MIEIIVLCMLDGVTWVLEEPLDVRREDYFAWNRIQLREVDFISLRKVFPSLRFLMMLTVVDGVVLMHVTFGVHRIGNQLAEMRIVGAVQQIGALAEKV
jgi:hypothetical protein